MAACRATNKDGSPCGAYVNPGAEWCRWHDPALAEERKRWARQGGKAKSNRRRAAKELELAAAGVGQLPAVLFRALGRVESGEIEPAVANAMASLSRAIVTVQQAHELEERLQALESRAGIARIPA